MMEDDFYRIIGSHIDSIISQHKIVVFAKSQCPFCIKTKKIMNDLNLNYAWTDIDTLDEQKAVYQTLYKKFNQQTVPYIFIKNHFVGGCSDFELLVNGGGLKQLLL